MEHISFELFDQIDLVDFLASIGIQPQKRKAWYYYYSSPLTGHPANRMTFIINRRTNRWRETTTKESGGLVDLAVRLYHCTIGELTAILRSALPPVPHSGSNGSPDTTQQITIEQTHPIRSAFLERHLWERRIPLNVARLFLLEAWYSRDKNLYHALAFRNDAGGFELFDRNRQFRVPPCGLTHIGHQSQSIAVFRNVFDLLTFAAIFAGPVQKFPDFLVLNAPVAFQAVQEIIASYPDIYLFLPNDTAGIAFSNQAARNLKNCHDHRPLYDGYPTLNDWICRIGTAPEPKTAVSPCNGQQPLANPPDRAKWPQNALTLARPQDG